MVLARKRVVAILVITAISLLTNILTIARQGVEKWIASVLNDGQLAVVWEGGERPPGISIQVRGENANGVEFDPDGKVALPAGRYAIKVMQLEKQLPVTLLSPDGKEVNYAEVDRFRTKTIRIRPTPTAPLFAGVYDLLADSLGRPKSRLRQFSRVFQGFHQNGTMLWFYDTQTFLVLKAQDGTAVELPDAPYPPDQCLYALSCVDEREHPPKGLHASFAGGYRVWNMFRKDLGWMTGYCIYWDSVTREDFENGFLVGPLRASPVGEIAVALGLYRDKDRQLWRTPTLFGKQPAECHDYN